MLGFLNRGPDLLWWLWTYIFLRPFPKVWFFQSIVHPPLFPSPQPPLRIESVLDSKYVRVCFLCGWYPLCSTHSAPLPNPAPFDSSYPDPWLLVIFRLFVRRAFHFSALWWSFPPRFSFPRLLAPLSPPHHCGHLADLISARSVQVLVHNSHIYQSSVRLLGFLNRVPMEVVLVCRFVKIMDWMGRSFWKIGWMVSCQCIPLITCRIYRMLMWWYIRKICIFNWSSKSNRKVGMCNLEDLGHIYAGQYQYMTPAGISKFFRALILYFFSPTIQFKKMLKLQYVSDMNGNKCISRCMGPNSKLK